MSKSSLVSVIVALVIVVLAFALNPSPERHREKIKETISERSPIAGVLGVGAITAFVSNYHNIGVASYTTVDNKTVSVGAFGIVFVREISLEK